MKQVDISVILPIFNEEDVIESTIVDVEKKIKKYCRKLEIIAVDDGSFDGTLKVLEKLKKKNKYLKIVVHRKNKGYGAVLRTGLKNASYSWIFFTDADMQFNPGEIKKFIPFTSDYDFIVGYRKKRADSPKRIFTSFVYNRLVRIMFGLPLRDVDCAFKLMSKESLKKVRFQSNSFFVSAEVMVRALKQNAKIKEIGVNHYPRTRNVSKVTIRKIIHTILDLFKLYRLTRI